MTQVSNTLSSALIRLANDRRRTVSNYANLTRRPGENQLPIRVMSDIGFLNNRPFTYVNTNQQTYQLDLTNPREILHIAMVPFGIKEDHDKITTTRNTLIPSLLHSDYLVPRRNTRLSQAVRRMTTRIGPSYHFLITKEGQILVGPPIDAEVSYPFTYKETAIVIGIESELTIRREEFDHRNFTNLIETPFTTTQLITLAILIQKLLTAFPDIPKTITLDPTKESSISYTTNEKLAWFDSKNLRNFTDPKNSPFNYDLTESKTFFELVTNQGEFNLANEVWRPRDRPNISAARSEARTVIGQVDTLGEESVMLGAYATIASVDRSSEMQGEPRRQMFVKRQQVAHHDADEAATQASRTAEAGNSTATILPTPTNVDPHVYDFTTGKWGDEIITT